MTGQDNKVRRTRGQDMACYDRTGQKGVKDR